MKNRKNNKFKMLFNLIIVFYLFIICACSCNTDSNKALVDIEEIPNELFTNITLLEVGQNDYSYSCVYQEDINKIIKVLNDLEVNEEPVSLETESQKEKDNYIFMRKMDGGYAKLFFNKDNTMVWVDRGDTYSHRFSEDETEIVSKVYRVKNKNILESIFEPLIPYQNEDLYATKYIDGRIFETEENKVVLKEERLDRNIYLMEEWLNGLEKEYKIIIDTTYDGKTIYEVGDKVRIKLVNSISKKNEIIKKEEIEEIYYLNELLYIKDVDYGNTEFFTKEEILLAMEDTIKNVFINRQQTSILYMYCDDEDAKDAEIFIKNLRENYVFDIKNELFVFFKDLPSRAMRGAEAKLNAHMYGKYGLGGFNSIERVHIEAMK